MNGEKEKFIGGVDFDELKAQRVQLYNTITVDLATARTNEEMVFTGTYIYALEATDVDANVDIRFNELFRANINIKKGRGVRVPFYRFYITNAAQGGKSITLAIGIEASDFEVYDVGKALGITGNVNVVPVPRTGYTQIAKSDSASNATVVLHTVTAGKTFYLTGANFLIYCTVAGTAFDFPVTNAADAIQYSLIKGIYMANVSIISPLYYSPPLEIPEGWKIKLISSDANIQLWASVFGYEV